MATRRPGVGIGAVIFRGDEVLIIRRGKPPREGQWSIPGGRQEWGETVAEAAAREVMEETAVHCRIRGLVDVVDGIGRDAEGAIEYHYTLVDMWGDWLAGEPVAGDDAAAACWMPTEAALEAVIWPETRRVIRAAQALMLRQL
ncbi:MAG: hypothetical protein TEF_13790 [Rhizobiales bacterium NRL2]|jgi:ADP-ribose pyrophosphatase YjhB (NUDIX family)|nr:MAG: hypothetical protein TEF_13790 [Rhizobiales bacterium NRL2]